METVNCKVEGMSCNNCALNISHYLEKEGMQDVMVSFATGDVRFQAAESRKIPVVLKGIDQLGYHVVSSGEVANKKAPFFKTTGGKLIFSLLFTVPLMLHMVIHWWWLQQSWVQLLFAVPVYLVGMWHFGKSAFRSIKNGMANMDVLITLGASAAFWYSIVGMALHLGDHYLFFETAAAILTLVLLGNWLEEKSVKQTTTAIGELVKLQVTLAKKITLINGKEEISEVENSCLVAGNKVLVNSGDQVPADGKIYWGNAEVKEAIITGESMPVSKKEGDSLIGGTIVESGTVKVAVTATGKDTVLSYIIELVKQAQGNKPPMQLLADRISAIFVPVVIGIALITFGGSYWMAHLSFTAAIMRSIAVLVIACPCAMGLATPAAVMVGLGRAARNGILIKGAHTLEAFKNIRQVVFDKTGTLTTSQIKITAFQSMMLPENEFCSIIKSLEQFSSHPIAKAIVAQWKDKEDISLNNVRELKGLGMEASDVAGNVYKLGSIEMKGGVIQDVGHDLYLLRNTELLGWIDLADEIRPEARQVVEYLKVHHIKTVLLSGDNLAKSQMVANAVGIDEVYAGQKPGQKLAVLEVLMQEAPTAMVGDGINDAPALAKADIGISLSDATQVAMQSANVVLLNNRLDSLPMALGLGKHTYLTIKQNLFWAFFYNIIAIPVAAFGFLSPIIGAAAMGLSDVVLAINSIRLKFKNVM
jgi:P-type Cu+ transporter